MKVFTYIYRGDVERLYHREGRAVTYRWHRGYSEGDDGVVSYPWMTKGECRADAASRGGVAKFKEEWGDDTSA